MGKRHTGPEEGKPTPPELPDPLDERRAQALGMKLAGLSYRMIGQQLGISHQQAFRDVSQATAELAAQRLEQTEHYVAIELARLDRLLMVVWPKAMRGEYAALDRALRILERIARLLGLDAPTKVAIDGKITLEGLFAMANQIESERHGTLFGRPLKLGGPESS